MLSASGLPKWFCRPLSIPPKERILEKPKEGTDVMHVQYALHAPLTGVYDDPTQQRVKGLQQAMGLRVTGIVDVQTARAIDYLTGERDDY